MEKAQDQPSRGEVLADHILEQRENRCYNYLITGTLESIQPNFAVIAYDR